MEKPISIDRETIMYNLTSSFEMANIAGLVAKYPRRGILLYKLLEDIKGSISPLSTGMRELIITYISGLHQQESGYGTDGTPVTRLAADESIVKQLKSDINSANVDEKLKSILRFVKKLTLTPDQITLADVKPIYDAGWDERAFHDSVYLCAVLNCINRFTMGIGVDMGTESRQERPPVTHSLATCHS